MALVSCSKNSVVINSAALTDNNAGIVNTTQVTSLVTYERDRFPGAVDDLLYCLKIGLSDGKAYIWRYDSALERSNDITALGG